LAKHSLGYIFENSPGHRVGEPAIKNILLNLLLLQSRIPNKAKFKWQRARAENEKERK
jgi:hypothetical protein